MEGIIIFKSNLKIGICQWSIPIDGPYACKIISELGIEGMQLDLGSYERGFHLSNKIVQKGYIELGRKYNISFPSIAVTELDNFNILGPQDSEETKIAKTAIIKAIDTAESMKIPLVLVPNFEKSRINNDNDFNRLVNVLQSTCDYAFDKGMNISTENILSIEDNIKLLKEVDRPNLKLYFDTQNPYLHKKYDISNMIDKLSPHICEVHVKDGKNGDLSGALLGTGDSGFYRSMESLKKMNYSGWVLLENYYDRLPLRLQNSNYFELIKEDLKILKSAIGKG